MGDVSQGPDETEDNLDIEQQVIYEAIRAYPEDRWCAGWMCQIWCSTPDRKESPYGLAV